MTTETITIDTPRLTPEQEQILKELETSGVFKNVSPEPKTFLSWLGISIICAIIIGAPYFADLFHMEFNWKIIVPYIPLLLYFVAYSETHSVNDLDCLKRDVLLLQTKDPLILKSLRTRYSMFFFFAMSIFATVAACFCYLGWSTILVLDDFSLGLYLLLGMSVVWTPLNLWLCMISYQRMLIYRKAVYSLTGYNLYLANNIIFETPVTHKFKDKESENKSIYFLIFAVMTALLFTYSVFIVSHYKSYRLQPVTNLIPKLESIVSNRDVLITHLDTLYNLRLEHAHCVGARCTEIEYELGADMAKPMRELDSREMVANQKKLRNIIRAIKENKLHNFIDTRVEFIESIHSKYSAVIVRREAIFLERPNSDTELYSVN